MSNPGRSVADLLARTRPWSSSVSASASTSATGDRGRSGVIIADRVQFGPSPGAPLLVDEVLTPDSSRFWPAEQYAPGRSQPSFDKQPLRDYLDAERKAGRWNGEPPPPPLPPDVVEATTRRYLQAFQRITGADLDLTRLS